MLQCIGKYAITLVFAKVHQAAYDNHIGDKAVAHKLLREGYYWPTLLKENVYFVKKCDQCQRHAALHHTPE